MGRAVGNLAAVSTAVTNRTAGQQVKTCPRVRFKREADVGAKNRIVLRNTALVGTIKRNAHLAFANVLNAIMSPRIKNRIKTYNKLLSSKHRMF